MNNANKDYYSAVYTIQTADNVLELNKALSNLSYLKKLIMFGRPEFIDSLKDIDYYIACGAYRINDKNLFEKTIQLHYYDDYRFKKLYKTYKEMETTNAWNGIVKKNATALEKTFVRSLSVVILTCVCVSLVFRK